MGFNPSCCEMLCTTGIEIEAAAVLLLISVRNVANSVRLNIVSQPPLNGSSVITLAICVAAPVFVISCPNARPPEKRKIIPHMMPFSASRQVRSS